MDTSSSTPPSCRGPHIGYLSYSDSSLLPDDNTSLNGVKCFHLIYILLQGL